MAAAFPLEAVKDPTGAGDSFAGGFMGHIAETGDWSWAGIRRAMVHGSVVASFTVEDFGVNRLLGLSRADIRARYELLRQYTAVESLAETEAAVALR